MKLWLCWFFHDWSVWSNAAAINGNPMRMSQWRSCYRCKKLVEKMCREIDIDSWTGF